MEKLITTREAQCKDCYRCLRSCPVKAISFTHKIQARVEEERCINCGRCVVECPQQAKAVRSELGRVWGYLERKERVVLSLAPSFAADYEELEQSLLSLGFQAVEETAWGAAYTTAEYKRIIAAGTEKTWLSSCCPVIVKYVQNYYPELVANLMPVLSPMAAHSRSIKFRYGEGTRVVFAGPCLGKLQEAAEYGVDAALTFPKLKELLSSCEPQAVCPRPQSQEVHLVTRMYPVHHGVLFSLQGKWEFQENHWAVEGLEQCREVLEALSRKEIAPAFLELMACTGGCVGGPAVDSPYSLYQRKQRVTDYCRHERPSGKEPLSPVFSMHKTVRPTALPLQRFSQEEVKAVLAKMGKHTPEDERNCEGCGYKSCRDKAQAVLEGMAVPEMCIPYMRARAESLANTIVQNTPNAILVLDEKMRVLGYNPAATRLWQDIPLKQGLVLKTYLDTDNFEKCLLTQTALQEIKVDYPQWGLHTRQVITPIGERQVMGIFTDLTQAQTEQEQVQRMKAEITVKAREVLNRQMTVAQTIAGLLGETTAETKATLLEILKHLDGEA